jgi:hypothetical protein
MHEPEIQERIDILRRICDRAQVIAVSRKDSLYVDIFQHLLNEIALISKCDEKIDRDPVPNKKIRDRPKNYKIVYEDRWKTQEIFCETLKRAEKIASRMTRHNKSAKATVSKVMREKPSVKPTCSVCGTTENVRWMGGHQPYLCDSRDCIPF